MIAFACAAAGSWLVLGCVTAVPIGRLLKRSDRGATTADRGEYIVWQSWLPPVPPSRRTVQDDWMALVPADCLSDDDPLLHRRFFAIVDAERVWFA